MGCLLDDLDSIEFGVQGGIWALDLGCGLSFGLRWVIDGIEEGSSAWFLTDKTVATRAKRQLFLLLSRLVRGTPYRELTCMAYSKTLSFYVLSHNRSVVAEFATTARRLFRSEPIHPLLCVAAS